MQQTSWMTLANPSRWAKKPSRSFRVHQGWWHRRDFAFTAVVSTRRPKKLLQPSPRCACKKSGHFITINLKVSSSLQTLLFSQPFVLHLTCTVISLELFQAKEMFEEDGSCSHSCRAQAGAPFWVNIPRRLCQGPIRGSG